MTRATLLRLLPAVLCALQACSGGEASQPGEEAAPGAPAPTGEHARELRDLVSAVSPLPATATALQETDWYARRKETLERLRAGPHSLGLAALQQYAESAGASREVRAGLLDVGSHCAPLEARPILIELVTKFGEDLGLRKSAVRFLGETSPAEATLVLEPLLETTEHGATYPPADALLEAYTGAMDAQGRDPTRILALVATDLRQADAARSFALKDLGKRPSPASRQALEAVLVESLGNNLSRRYAAQALRASLPKEELCPVLQRVFDNEADIGFQQFLASMLEEACY